MSYETAGESRKTVKRCPKCGNGNITARKVKYCWRDGMPLDEAGEAKCAKCGAEVSDITDKYCEQCGDSLPWAHRG